MRRISHNTLIQRVAGIACALDRGEFDHLFESLPEYKQRLSAALDDALGAVVDAELRSHPELYQQCPNGGWRLRTAEIIELPGQHT